MPQDYYANMDDEQLGEMLFFSEDRLSLEAARTIAGNEVLFPFLCQLVMDKKSWLLDLPEWWGVVHASYILALRGGGEVVLPLLSALRWSDAFDCDWVTELMPSMLGAQGPAVTPGLTAVVRDATAGWSARDLAMKGLAAITLGHPQAKEHNFRIIGERFMDEGENRIVRQLAGQILLDFRAENYRLPLLKFAREELSIQQQDNWQWTGFSPEEVEWCFHSPEPETWHYQEDWMRFYDPAEIQKRQKRWAKERLGFRADSQQNGRVAKNGQLLSLWRRGEKNDNPPDSGGNDE